MLQKPIVRQGWLRALIYYVGVSFILYFFSNYGSSIVSSFSSATEKEDEKVLQFGIMYSLLGLVLSVFTWLCRKFIDRKSFKSLGFYFKDYANEAGLGFFTAIALLGIGSIILVALGYLSFTGASFDAGSLLPELAILLAVAFTEELVFRGYLLNNLLQSVNKWGALGITAALFSLFHGSNPDITLFAVLNIFLAGILLGLNYIFTRNLWFGILFHFAWNYYQGPVLGYEVSGLKLNGLLHQSISGPQTWTGGPFGFEGSLLCPLLFMVAIGVLLFSFLKRYRQSL